MLLVYINVKSGLSTWYWITSQVLYPGRPILLCSALLSRWHFFAWGRPLGPACLSHWLVYHHVPMHLFSSSHTIEASRCGSFLVASRKHKLSKSLGSYHLSTLRSSIFPKLEVREPRRECVTRRAILISSLHFDQLLDFRDLLHELQ